MESKISPHLHLGIRSQLQQRSGNSQAHELTRVSQNRCAPQQNSLSIGS
jgi:hypothetical protein